MICYSIICCLSLLFFCCLGSLFLRLVDLFPPIRADDYVMIIDHSRKYVERTKNRFPDANLMKLRILWLLSIPHNRVHHFKHAAKWLQKSAKKMKKMLKAHRNDFGIFFSELNDYVIKINNSHDITIYFLVYQPFHFIYLFLDAIKSTFF